MNKILVNNIEKDNIDSKYVLDHDDNIYLELDDINKELFLVVKENVNITFNIFGKCSDLKLNVSISENSNLIINTLILEGKFNISINMEGKNSTVYSNYSVVSSENSHNKIEVKHLVSNTNSYLSNHGFSLNKADIILDVNGCIPKESSKCVSHQDNQIIEIEDSLSQINPNLYIENYDVEASHAAYIGEFKEEALFYMMSRGISMDDAKFLLLKAFLLGNFKFDDTTYDNYMNGVTKYFNREV